MNLPAVRTKEEVEQKLQEAMTPPNAKYKLVAVKLIFEDDKGNKQSKIFDPNNSEYQLKFTVESNLEGHDHLYHARKKINYES